MKYGRLMGAALCTLLLGSSAMAQPIYEPVAAVEQPGSVLIFPKFNIGPDYSTQLRITNIHETAYVTVKLNYVCPGVKRVNDLCRSLDRTLTMTPHETRIIDVADHNPPCEKGFVVAFAQNYGLLLPKTPISFNYLTGSYHISQGRNLASENALAVQSPLPCFVPTTYDLVGLDDDDDAVEIPVGALVFGTQAPYKALGSELYTDFRAIDNVIDNGSRLTLLSLDTLAGQQNPATSVYVYFWNAAETPFSSTHEFVCWDSVRLDNIDLNFLEENLGTEYGSMAVGSLPNCPLPGGCPPLNYYEPVVLGAIEEFIDDCGRSIRNLFMDDYPRGTYYLPR